MSFLLHIKEGGELNQVEHRFVSWNSSLLNCLGVNVVGSKSESSLLRRFPSYVGDFNSQKKRLRTSVEQENMGAVREYNYEGD